MWPRIYVYAFWLLLPVFGMRAASPGKVTLLVVNSADANRQTLKEAERLAASIFRQAGVEVEWRDCRTELCPEVQGPGEFWMHVARWRPVTSAGETLGFALMDAASGAGAQLAGVYYPMVEEMARSYRAQESIILSAALAHEIGHLMGVGHAVRGVMSARFDRARMVEMSCGRLGFTDQEADRLRSAGNRRAPETAVESGVPPH